MDLQAVKPALLPGGRAACTCTSTSTSSFNNPFVASLSLSSRCGFLRKSLVCDIVKRRDSASRRENHCSGGLHGRKLQFTSAIAKPDRPIDKSEVLQEDPYGRVSQVMSDDVVTTKPDVTLDQILPLFEKFTGLPVVDEEGHCVGMISNVDIYKFLRGRVESLSKTVVSEVMTCPAFVIKEKAPVAYAAGLMLQHKVHRLPVVDDNGVVIGIITRTDIYQPLMPPVNPVLHRLVGKNNIGGSTFTD